MNDIMMLLLKCVDEMLVESKVNPENSACVQTQIRDEFNQSIKDHIPPSTHEHLPWI